LDFPGNYLDNRFGLFVFFENLKEQLHIEQEYKIRKKKSERKV
jgi:hypothetical protein